GPRALGEAVLGVSRPDVGKVHRRYPGADRAGWSFLVRHDALLAEGDDPHAPIDLHVRAHNAEGASVELGPVRLMPPAAGDDRAASQWVVARPR
ncbi:MAG TPA: hypothetical protein VK824_04230, partial [Planctomycetota bacterium]|nr:hypothetical protein [Planctomycetota bacterium]